jgi:hypothetical protein
LPRRSIALHRTAAMHHAQTSHAFFSSAQVRSWCVHFQSRNVVQLTRSDGERDKEKECRDEPRQRLQELAQVS